MDHVDQALYTRPNLSGGTKRSAQKTALIGIALAALAGFVSSASAESILPARATGPIQVVGAAGPTQAWINFCQSHPDECRVDLSQPARISTELAGVGCPHTGERARKLIDPGRHRPGSLGCSRPMGLP